MALMKKYLFIIMPLLVIVVAFAMPFSVGAHAGDSMFAVIGENVYLLDLSDGHRIFLLPESYYAPVIGMDATFYHIVFNGVEGKVEKASVSFTGYSGIPSDTMRGIKIDEKFSMLFTEMRLKARMDGASDEAKIPVNSSLVFLGHYPMAEMWYYVRYDNNVCGYIPANFTNMPEIVIDKFVPDRVGNSDPTPFKTEKPPTSLLKVLVITGSCVAGVVLFIIIFKPPKTGKKRYYYED